MSTLRTSITSQLVLPSSIFAGNIDKGSDHRKDEADPHTQNFVFGLNIASLDKQFRIEVQLLPTYGFVRKISEQGRNLMFGHVFRTAERGGVIHDTHEVNEN